MVAPSSPLLAHRGLAAHWDEVARALHFARELSASITKLRELNGGEPIDESSLRTTVKRLGIEELAPREAILMLCHASSVESDTLHLEAQDSTSPVQSRRTPLAEEEEEESPDGPFPSWRPPRGAGALKLRQELVEKMQLLVHALASWDTDGGGKMDKPAFRRAVSTFGMVTSRADLEELFDSFDQHCTGQVDYISFSQFLLKQTPPAPPPPPSKPPGYLNNDAGSLQTAAKAADPEFLKDKQRLKDALSRRLAQMSNRFEKMDGDGDGTIDKHEFRSAVRTTLGLSFENDVIDSVFQGYDTDGSGQLEYNEFIRYSLRDSLARSASRVMTLFRSWDTDQSGTVGKLEFRRGLRQIGFDAPKAVLDQLFREMDSDGGGQIEFKEMHRALRQGRAVKMLSMPNASDDGSPGSPPKRSPSPSRLLTQSEMADRRKAVRKEWAIKGRDKKASPKLMRWTKGDDGYVLSDA